MSGRVQDVDINFTMLEGETHKTRIPAVALRFRDPDCGVLESDVKSIGRVDMVYTAVTPSRATLLIHTTPEFYAEGLDDSWLYFVYEMPVSTAHHVLTALHDYPHYLFVITTPGFESKQLVDSKTSRVVDAVVSGRVLH